MAVWSAARAEDVNQTISAGFPQVGPAHHHFWGSEKKKLKARDLFRYLKRKWEEKGDMPDI